MYSLPLGDSLRSRSVTTLPGIGRARAERLQRLGIATLEDLLLHLPRSYQDRSRFSPLTEALRQGEGLVCTRVLSHEYFPFRRERVLKIIVHDETSAAALVCFGRAFLARLAPVGSEVRIWGQFSLRRGEIQSSAFEIEPHDPQRPLAGIIPVYPLTEGISQTVLRNALKSAWALAAPHLGDDLPDRLRARAGGLTCAEALRAVHWPQTLPQARQSRHRLIFGELFLFQKELALETLARRRARRVRRQSPGKSLVETVLKNLPYQLTPDQARVLGEIRDDLRHPWPMARLLQGDVGCGKTLVALLAACAALEQGRQAALMVPTELLARQHLRNARELLAPAGLTVRLVLGGLPKAEKEALADDLSQGRVDLAVGTHALLSETYSYPALGLVIIDEQHRFGVRQRELLTRRGENPDVLMMSATPIPRSLALTAFGDMEISTIHHLPPGRSPVTTHLARIGNEERVYRFLRRHLDEGHQAYLVYPAIEEGESGTLRSATAMEERLTRELAPHRVGLVHSRLSEEDRSTRMDLFASGELAALVATSVVEVGVDVPNATVMVIEQAERFGLASLHQLRGRVGRGPARSYCILVYQEPLTEEARQRLKVLYKTTDGFVIAEEDLRIRGPGDLPGESRGLHQSGFLAFRLADIRQDMTIMTQARQAVREDLAVQGDLAVRENLTIQGDLAQNLPGETKQNHKEIP
ncbi:ATP-dependent DNA helicase RecG [Alkalispirochaeta americana]|uniref:ATP-dependent DNA helicase RecG n=1 Tax=Alkalispirochaeta americana TaxID=159291 RepID=A0A1N6WI75_9SPIO|nr:ATP-dependent DNA helicase RecG [Alkalispirochaeta americana]SIQ89676.1 ATP-dependent DNA helicase RecG [Alkalispirochaeta americana]